MEDKTVIYDEQIKPFLDQIENIAAMSEIPFIAIFQPNNAKFTGSLSIPQHASDQMKDSAQWWMNDVDTIEVKERYGGISDEKEPPLPSARELFDRMPVTLPQEAKDTIEQSLRQKLAQKILEMIEKTDQKIEQENASVRREYELLDLLKEEIIALCQEEVKS